MNFNKWKSSKLIWILLILIVVSTSIYAEIIFEDNFDNQNDWTRTQPSSQALGDACYPPMIELNGKCDLPLGYTYRYNGGSFCYSKSFPNSSGENTLRLSNFAGYKNSSNTGDSCRTGKCLTFWDESCTGQFENSDGNIGTNFSGQDDIYIRYYIKFQKNFKWQESTGGEIYKQHKLYHIQQTCGNGSAFAFFGTDCNLPSSVGGLAVWQWNNLSTPQVYFEMAHRCEESYYCNGQINKSGFGSSDSIALGNLSYLRENGGLFDNNWHSIEIHYKMNSFNNGIPQTDGVYAFWLDGKLKLNYSDIPWSDKVFHNLDATSITNVGNTPNRVRINITNNQFHNGNIVTINGTINYDGIYRIVNSALYDGSGDWIDIEHEYFAEIFNGNETATSIGDESPRRNWNFFAIGGNNNNQFETNCTNVSNCEQWYSVDDLTISTSYVGTDWCDKAISDNLTSYCDYAYSNISTNLSVANLSAVENLTLEYLSLGKVKWFNTLNISGYDFDRNMKFEKNFISINSAVLKNLNSTAEITFYNVSYYNPKILKDGVGCTNCKIVNYENNTFVFLVSSFSNYSIEENPLPPVLHFTDIISGPKTGNTDGAGGLNSSQHGAIVTVWGNFLGTTQGSSNIFINDSFGNSYPAAHIYYWKNADGQLPGGPSDLYTYHKMQEVAFSIPSNVSDGLSQIYAIVNDVQSEGLNFTIRDGRILFIKQNGNDTTGNGSWNNSWKTLQNVMSGNGKIIVGDVVYSVGVGSNSGINVGSYGAIKGNATNHVALVVYPNTSVVISGKAYSGSVIFHFYGNDINRSSDYIDFSKISIIAAYINSSEDSSNGINVFRDNRIIGIEITGPTVYSGYGGAITGSGSINAGGGKYYGIYIHNYGTANNVPYVGDYHTWTSPDDCATHMYYARPSCINESGGCTYDNPNCRFSSDRYQHLYYISNRGGGSNVEGYEIAWNYLTDNPILHGIHVFDEGSAGGWNTTIKVYNNVVKNQRGGAIDFAYPNASDAEIYNNIIISDVDDVYSGHAFSMNPSGNIKIYNNLVYGYRIANDFGKQFPPIFYDSKNNIFIDNHNVSFISNKPDNNSNNLYFSYFNNDKPSWDINQSFYSDPLFINSQNFDFRLRELSPAIDAGSDDVLDIVSTDFFGVKRVPGKVDIGPFEFVNTSDNFIVVKYNTTHFWYNETTKFGTLTDDDLQSISNVSFVNNFGKIWYLEIISITRNLDLTNQIKIENKKINLNYTNIDEFNKTKKMIFKNVTYIHPIVKKDNLSCLTCSNVSYNSTTKELEFVD